MNALDKKQTSLGPLQQKDFPLHFHLKKPSRFLQALLWSLGFHLFLLSILSIHTFFLPKDPPLHQVDIQLDMGEEIATIHTSAQDNSLAWDSFLESYSIKYEPFLEAAITPSSQENKNSSSPLIRSYATMGVPWMAEEELHLQKARIYPLKLSLHYGLAQLYVVDDGSSLFVPATYETLSLCPLFSHEIQKVVFLVHVDTTTGIITKTKCSFPLKDTKLQQLAHTILATLKFCPKERPIDREVHGEITLQFATSFDEIEPLLCSFKKRRWPI